MLLKKSYGFVSWLVGLSFAALLLPFSATGMATGKAKAKTKTVKQAGADDEVNTRLCASGKNKNQLLPMPTGPDMVAFARRFIGRPYRCSAKGPSAFDCSGFTGYIYKHFGLHLPACSKSQSTIGDKINVSEAQPGDLVFFGRRGKKGRISIYHAGIVASAKGEALKVIHAASRIGVTVTDLSQSGYWKRNLVSIRRLTGHQAPEADTATVSYYPALI